MSWRVDLQCTESRCVGRNMTRRHQIRLLLMIGLVSRLTHSGKSGREEAGDSAPQMPELTAFNRTWSDAGEQGARARGWRPQEPGRSSWALAERAPQWPRCCENGGTCVLGSFCVCPAHFTGRHCEHDQRHSDCGALGHGAWTVRGCRLCRCVFGSLHCLRRQTLGRCDLKDFVPAHAAGQRAHLLLLLLCLFLQSLIRCP